MTETFTPVLDIVKVNSATIYAAGIVKSPRAWMERRVPLVHWTFAPHGGHFAAFEVPECFVHDFRTFVRSVVDGRSEGTQKTLQEQA
jgi:epoxide hydrolase